MKVSVWIGNSPSWDVLDEYLTFHFNEDGEAIPCRFAELFQIDWFDEDYREASVSEERTINGDNLLQEHSQGKAISDQLGKLCTMATPCNAVVLLFDFNYSGLVKSADLGMAQLEFIGTADISL